MSCTSLTLTNVSLTYDLDCTPHQDDMSPPPFRKGSRAQTCCMLSVQWVLSFPSDEICELKSTFVLQKVNDKTIIVKDTVYLHLTTIRTLCHWITCSRTSASLWEILQERLCNLKLNAVTNKMSNSEYWYWKCQCKDAFNCMFFCFVFTGGVTMQLSINVCHIIPCRLQCVYSS